MTDLHYQTQTNHQIKAAEKRLIKQDYKEFDKLECVLCDEVTSPHKYNQKPEVFYKCSCGASWRINSGGDLTHLRDPKPLVIS